MKFIVDALNYIFAAFGSIFNTILLILPDSPFNYVSNIDNQWLKAINWMFPVSEAVAHLEMFCAVVAMYYTVRTVLKWIKAVGS
ncbi:MAG: hypothetical protein A4E55_00119 [Pelotomaculum sp. PtaU1.Bin035]|nr:MAG: hypothetical protein A4E55_00119 [Pelotomaculum sp. PtaU1.Bin035]